MFCKKKSYAADDNYHQFKKIAFSFHNCVYKYNITQFLSFINIFNLFIDKNEKIKVQVWSFRRPPTLKCGYIIFKITHTSHFKKCL